MSTLNGPLAPPFKVLNIRIPIIIPIKGREFTNHGSGLSRGLTAAHMGVSKNRGTPILTLQYDNPHYGDPQKGTRNFGKATYINPRTDVLRGFEASLASRARPPK